MAELLTILSNTVINFSELETKVKRDGVIVFIDLVTTLRYDYGFPTEPWIYGCIGICIQPTTDQLKHPCTKWLREPLIKRFKSLEDALVFLAFQHPLTS